MNFRKTLLAASVAAIVAAPAMAASMMASGASASPQEVSSVVGHLMNSRSAQGMSNDHGFAPTRLHPGVAGTKVHRMSHTYKGVRVFGSESVVVSDENGRVVDENHSNFAQGLGAESAKPIDMNPKLSAQAVINQMVKALAPNGVHTVPAKAELILYPVIANVRNASAAGKTDAQLNAVDLRQVVTGYELAYVVSTRMVDAGKPVLWDTIVSAMDGTVLKSISAMHNAGATLTGITQYSGTKSLPGDLTGSTYSIKDTAGTRATGGTYGGIAITNANHTSSAGAVYSSSSSTFGDGQNYISGGSTTNANGQTAATDSMWGAVNTYDLMKNVLGWRSLNGQNTAFYISVHVNTNYDNAYYDDSCKCMFIGDGSSFKVLSGIDVIGHEMGHGVTAATSNLTYSGESGGLNESASDINGEMVEAYAKAGGTGSTVPNTGNDWKMGTEISKTGTPLRYMFKPNKDGKSPDAWSSSIGGIDVHYSSGPNNRMFYFLSQGSQGSGTEYYSSYLNKLPATMTGIGSDKAYRIWFKALTTKMTTSTNYASARTLMMQSAAELYGSGSPEHIAVQRAYAAINVGADVNESGVVTPLGIATQPANVTVAPGATATFSVVAQGGTSPYAYQWYRNGGVIAGATSATYSLANAQTTDSGATFNVKITDSAATPASVTSGNGTLTVSTAPTDLMVNGGFESGATSWVGTTGAIGTWAAQPAASGTKNAWLGGNGVSGTESLYQTVSIPTNATGTLTFALHIDTAETTTSTQYDKLTVTLKNTSGTTLKTLATYSNLNKAAGYSTKTFDVSAYKGQTVRVSFSETEDSSLQTSFVIDNVTLK